MSIRYRDHWTIRRENNGPFTYSYVHDDYDGAPDGNDNRCGCTKSIAEAQEEIDEIEES